MYHTMATGGVKRFLLQANGSKFLQSTWVKATTYSANRQNSNFSRIMCDLSSSGVSPFVSKGEYVARVLINEQEIRQAQALVYDVYIKELGWMWTQGNSTGFQIKRNLDISYVTDRFEGNSVIWSGTFHRDQLVGGARLNFRTPENPLLDVECYDSAYKPSIRKTLQEENIAGLSRIVTMKDYRSDNVVTFSLMIAAKILLMYNHSTAFTSQFEFSDKHGSGLLLDQDYDYGDGVKTKLWFYSQCDLENILKLYERKTETILKE